MNAITRRAALLSFGALTILATAVRRRPALELSPLHSLWLDSSVDIPAGNTPDVILEPELIAQWRRELRERLRQHGRPAVALVRWDKAIMLAGLSREEGWRTQTQRLGHGVFRVDLMT
jgi:hypothetical protein